MILLNLTKDLDDKGVGKMDKEWQTLWETRLYKLLIQQSYTVLHRDYMFEWSV